MLRVRNETVIVDSFSRRTEIDYLTSRQYDCLPAEPADEFEVMAHKQHRASFFAGSSHFSQTLRLKLRVSQRRSELRESARFRNGTSTRATGKRDTELG
jgi:hypothetical protein